MVRTLPPLNLFLKLMSPAHDFYSAILPRISLLVAVETLVQYRKPYLHFCLIYYPTFGFASSTTKT